MAEELLSIERKYRALFNMLDLDWDGYLALIRAKEYEINNILLNNKINPNAT